MRGRFSFVPAGLLVAGPAIPSQRQAVRLEVPFVAQEKNGCGAASLAMVMQYWQRQQGGSTETDVQSIHRALYSREARGVHASDMQRYLGQHGFRTYAFHGEWSDLEHHLLKGRPLIVALKTGRNDLHYVVATGFDRQRGVVLKHDPAVRSLLAQHRADFEKEWRGANNWTLLALPESQSSLP
jgi:predicted double-glycine peptidase